MCWSEGQEYEDSNLTFIFAWNMFLQLWHEDWRYISSPPGHVSVAHRGRTLVWGGYMENQVLLSFPEKLWFDCFIYDAALLKWNSDELDFFRTETMIITGALLRSGCITAWPGVGQYRSWFYPFYLQPWNNFRILFLSLVLIITVFLQRTTGDVPTKCSGSAACVLDDTMYVVAGFHR